MISRILTLSGTSSYFLLGPRGVGKTKFLRIHFPDALYIDLLEDEKFNMLISSTQRLEQLIEDSGKKQVVIDEVQKIPRILDEVHRLIEKKNIQFILTGSSARKLKRSGVNLLAGRAITKYMYPLTALELGAKHDFSKSLLSGLLPSAYLGADTKQFLSSYVATYLKEEIQQEGLTRNLGAFSRFLEAASLSQAQQINISDVARQCFVERKTVEQYFTILEDLMLATRLPVFTKKASRDMTQHPKFFLFDVGVYRALRPKGPLDMPEEIDGAAFETLLFQEMRAVNDYCDLGYYFYFWRTKTKLEVDLIAYGERGIVACEVKRTAHVRREDIRGLLAFKEDYPASKLFLFYGGATRYTESGITFVPLRDAMSDIRNVLS